jgi:hypothetical protein
MKVVLAALLVPLVFAAVVYGGIRLGNLDIDQAVRAAKEVPSPPEELSEAEFRKRATTICRRADAALEALPKPRQQADLGGYTRKLAALQHSWSGKFLALDPPHEKRVEFDRLAALIAIDDRRMDDLAAAAGRRDTATMKVILAEGDRRSRKEKRLLRSLGLRTCADL